MKLDKFGSLTKEQIRKLENKLGLTLPIDYVDFLIKTNGGALVSYDAKEITIEEINQNILIDIFFGYETNDKSCDILYWMDFLIDELIDSMVVVATDAGDGYVVIVCNEENKGIWYWDASYNFEQSNDEKNVYRICNTFNELLDILN